MSSPAEVVRLALVGLGIVGDADVNPVQAWPAYRDTMPPAGNGVPVNIVVIYTTEAIIGSKTQRGKVVEERPGIQIRIRCNDADAGYTKAVAVKDALDGIAKLPIAIGDTTYTVWAVKRRGGVLPMGEDPEDNRNSHFSINAQATITSKPTPIP